MAFGGGSGLDLGKMVTFMAGQTRPVRISRISATGVPEPMPTHHPDDCGADDRRHGSEVGRLCHHQLAYTCEEDHLPSADAASIVIADPDDGWHQNSSLGTGLTFSHWDAYIATHIIRCHRESNGRTSGDDLSAAGQRDTGRS